MYGAPNFLSHVNGAAILVHSSTAPGGRLKLINRVETDFEISAADSDLAHSGVVVSAGMPDGGSGDGVGEGPMIIVPATKSM